MNVISQEHFEEIFLKLCTNVHSDSRMNGLDVGSHVALTLYHTVASSDCLLKCLYIFLLSKVALLGFVKHVNFFHCPVIVFLAEAYNHTVVIVLITFSQT